MVDIKIVVGANYGDEGKGLITDFVCRRAQKQHGARVVNVLANGGCQRGHTVVSPDGVAHVFHHFGAGTLAGADNYFCSRFIINPMRFVDELNTLKKKFGLTPTVLMHKNCRLQFPGDIAANWYLERARGGNKHGSTGCGIWETVKRFKKTQEDIMNLNAPVSIWGGMTLPQFVALPVDEQFDWIEKSGKRWLELTRLENGLGYDYTDLENLFLNAGFIKHYIEDCKQMYEYVKYILPDDKHIFTDYRTVVLEYGQGLLLDQEYGADEKVFADYGYSIADKRHTTPSSTGAYDAAWAVNNCLFANASLNDVEVIYVTRPYVTRHGAGRFEEDTLLTKMFGNSDLTNVDNEWQGSIKYGALSTRSCKHRATEDFNKFCEKCVGDHKKRMVFALTHCDQFEDSKTLGDLMTSNGLYLSYGPKASDVKFVNPPGEKGIYASIDD